MRAFEKVIKLYDRIDHLDKRVRSLRVFDERRLMLLREVRGLKPQAVIQLYNKDHSMDGIAKMLRMSKYRVHKIISEGR